MEHIKRLTAQQLVIAACASTLTAGVMLSRHATLGWIPLVVAVLCGLGAYVKSEDR